MPRAADDVRTFPTEPPIVCGLKRLTATEEEYEYVHTLFRKRDGRGAEEEEKERCKRSLPFVFADVCSCG